MVAVVKTPVVNVGVLASPLRYPFWSFAPNRFVGGVLSSLTPLPLETLFFANALGFSTYRGGIWGIQRG